MLGGFHSGWAIVVLLLELISLWLIWKLWGSEEHLFFKISLSLLLLIPVFGPLLVLWINNNPPELPHALRDQEPRRTDVYDRWRHVFETKNPVKRYRDWRGVIEKEK